MASIFQQPEPVRALHGIPSRAKGQGRAHGQGSLMLIVLRLVRPGMTRITARAKMVWSNQSCFFLIHFSPLPVLPGYLDMRNHVFYKA